MKNAKVASTSEIIEKLMEFEAKHGVGAVTSISSMCSGTRETEYCLNISSADNSVKEQCEIQSILFGDLNENPAYKETVASKLTKDMDWHDMQVNPNDEPPINERVILEFVVVGTSDTIHLIGFRQEDGQYNLDMSPALLGNGEISVNLVAWKTIIPHTR